ncbi:MAG TPA: hypothetical protein VJH65_01770 [Candidatus Nanoarchaeia archaeon]|nr:hypothetical protein [Candidatus Nanoarchaeia archaeon]
MKKSRWITVIIITAILILSYFILTKKNPQMPEDLAKCIGENSILYIQNGCIHCINQEKIFGENFKFLNYVNCTNNWDACAEILGTPTWIINKEKHVGVQKIERLQELTGCK